MNTNLNKQDKINYKESEEKEKKWYQRITLPMFVMATITAIIVMLALAIVYSGVNSLRPTQIAEGIEEIRLESANGQIVMQYKLYDNNGRKVLLIVANNISDTISLRNLVNGIVYSKGLTLNDVDIVLKDLDEDSSLSPEAYFAQIENEVDPLNPLFQSDNNEFYQGEETIDPIDFRLYILATRYEDSRFRVVQLDENTFRIELKEDFTEERFRNEFLKNFLNTDGITFIFVDQNSIREETP